MRSSDGPFSADPAIEKRLVALGVAEYVGPPVATPPNGGEGNEQGDNTSDSEKAPDGEGDAPSYDKDSTIEELRAIADVYCIKLRKNMPKSQIIAALDKFFSETGADGSDDEDLKLEAESPV